MSFSTGHWGGAYYVLRVDKDDLPSQEPYSSVEISCFFVRSRNALAVCGQFAPLFVDYYLHLAQHGLRLSAFQDAALKDGLAALTLHLAARPRNESHGWTLHFQRPLVNLFLTGDNGSARVTGRMFDKDVRETDRNMFFAQVHKKGVLEPRTSVVEFNGVNVFRAAENFYAQSEQRMGRYFDFGDEQLMLVTAQPGCDIPWLESVTADELKELDARENISLLERREYHFECGCNVEKIWEVLLPHCRHGVEELFGANEFLIVGCRRCGAEYRIQREQFEAFVEARTK
jgi:molecular chaperone Hsp33